MRAQLLLATRRLTVVLLVVISAALHVHADEPPEPTRFAADRPVDCLHIRLDLAVDLEAKSVSGQAAIDLTALRPLSSVIFDAVDLNVTAVAVSVRGAEQTAASFVNTGSTIEVLLDEQIQSGDSLKVVIDYSLEDPDSGLHFFGPTDDDPDTPYLVWSQGETTDNRYWFPCFDHPNERQSTELIVTTKKPYRVSSNGRLLSHEEDPVKDTVTYHWLQDKPHAAYLVSMIVGEFVVTTETWRRKPIEYWVHPTLRTSVHRTFKNTVQMLDFFSERIGVDYPWQRYAQICCAGFGGGMENTSATTLGDRMLQDERSILDSDSDGLIAHELAHQWFGDLLTCREWSHLWLNEGFASYFEALWEEQDRGEDAFAYNMYRKAAAARRGGQRGPIVDRAYQSEGAMFDSRAYSKGAWVLHMIRRQLGDDTFWNVMHNYTVGHANQSVETVDLRKTIEQVTGRSFERFFYDWTQRPGHPQVKVSYDWLTDEHLARLTVEQAQDQAAFHFPLPVEFTFDDDLPARRVTPRIEDKNVVLYYALPAQPTGVRVDPEQSVLMELEERKSKALWAWQLTEDPAVDLRIRAAEHFGQSKKGGAVDILADALNTEPFWAVRAEIASELGHAGTDGARDALVECVSGDDPKVRRACVEALAEYPDNESVIQAVRPLVVDGDPSYYVEAAAVETYTKLGAADAITILPDVLNRDSRNEVLRTAALAGLGSIGNREAIELLCVWTRADKPRQCRGRALRALGETTKSQVLDEATTLKIVETVAEALEATNRRVRSSAVSALGNLQDPRLARSTLDTLRRIADQDPSERTRRAAERTIKAIESDQPADVRVTELQEQLNKAIEQNKELADRLEQLESRLNSMNPASDRVSTR